jgi:hypothetical protein
MTLCVITLSVYRSARGDRLVDLKYRLMRVSVNERVITAV